MKTHFFIAINISEELKSQLKKYQDYWPEITAKWVSQENLHLTIAFLGQLSEKRIDDIKKIIKGVKDEIEPFDLTIEKISYSPPNSYKFIWANLKNSKKIIELKKILEKEIAKTKINNIQMEEDEFLPHITLAKIDQMKFKQTDSEEVPEVNEDLDIKIQVNSIELMESTLKKTGLEYKIIETFKLKKI